MTGQVLKNSNPNINTVVKSMGPIFEIITQIQRTIEPQLSMMQSVAQNVHEQHKRLSVFLTPPKKELLITRPEPALTYSDIPYIGEVVADKLAVKIKVAKHTKNNSSGKCIFFQDYALFLSSNPKNKYQMRLSPKRREMLMILINAGNKFTPTRFIRDYAGSKNNETVRKELKTLNNKICDALGLSGDLIVSVPEVGYRINSKYKIRVIV